MEKKKAQISAIPEPDEQAKPDMSRHVTPCHAMSHLENEDKISTEKTGPVELPLNGGTGKKPAPVATRWPADRRVPDEWIRDAEQICASKGWNVDARVEAVAFANYWVNAPKGSKGTKIDWGRTFVNWVISAGKYAPRARSTGGNGK